MDEGYFSHISLLSAAVIRTTGPVLELGAGLGSTLMLHGMCGAMGRELVTLESDEEWLGKFIGLRRSWHTIRRVESFLELEEYSRNWGLVFIDHGIAEQRGHSLRVLKDAPMIVCHDTCHPFLYNYEPLLSSFPFRWNYKPHGLGGSNPMTTVVSSFINLGPIFAEMQL